MVETIQQLQSIPWLLPAIKIFLGLCLASFGWLAVFVWIAFLKKPIPKWLTVIISLIWLLFLTAAINQQAIILEFLASFFTGLSINGWIVALKKQDKVARTAPFKISFILGMFLFVAGLVFLQLLSSTDPKILELIVENLTFGLEVTLIGNLVVFSALVLVWQIMDAFRTSLWGLPERLMMLIRYLLTKKQKLPAPVARQVETTPVISTPPAGTISPDIVAAITAAIAVTIDKKFMITRIRYRQQPPEGAWNKHGIASIMTSHSPKRYGGR